MSQPVAIGVDLGGSSIKAVCVNARGDVVHRHRAEFNPESVKEWEQGVRDVVQNLESTAGTPHLQIGLSAPGLAAPDRRSIACMPGRLQGLEGLVWSKVLGRDGTVPVLNDGHAALLGEIWAGAGRGCRNLFMLTLGTGVGGAAVVDGRLLLGRLGRAGHLGHISLDPDGPPDICSTPGSLEGAIGNCTIGPRTGHRFSSTHELVEHVRGGDPAARAVWDRSLTRLAAAVVGLINVLDPERVLIGGGIARSGETLLGPLREKTAQMEWRPGGASVQILPAQLEEYAGAIGAAWMGLHDRLEVDSGRP